MEGEIIKAVLLKDGVSQGTVTVRLLPPVRAGILGGFLSDTPAAETDDKSTWALKLDGVTIEVLPGPLTIRGKTRGFPFYVIAKEWEAKTAGLKK